MHVRITDKGRRVLNDKQLAARVILAINDNKEKLASGESVHVGDSKVSIKMVTTIQDAACISGKFSRKKS